MDGSTMPSHKHDDTDVFRFASRQLAPSYWLMIVCERGKHCGTGVSGARDGPRPSGEASADRSHASAPCQGGFAFSRSGGDPRGREERRLQEEAAEGADEEGDPRGAAPGGGGRGRPAERGRVAAQVFGSQV